VQGGLAGVFVEDDGWNLGYLEWDVGNINSDPLFVYPAGPDGNPETWQDNDYRLADGSPCMEAGDNSALPADAGDLDKDGNTTEPIPLDLDGVIRVYDGDTNGTATVDMGPYEYGATTPSCTTPGTPTANAPTNVVPTEADLSWSPGTPTGSGVVRYFWAVGLSDTVTYESGYVDRGVVTHPSTSAHASTLTPETTYYFTVRACTTCDDTCSPYTSPPIEFATPAVPIPGDFDGDQDVDQEDFGHFQVCLTGEGVSQNEPGCADAKLDGDTDVDADDFSIFLGCLSGANVPADVDCAD
jgi:hypothetical protein